LKAEISERGQARVNDGEQKERERERKGNFTEFIMVTE